METEESWILLWNGLQCFYSNQSPHNQPPPPFPILCVIISEPLSDWCFYKYAYHLYFRVCNIDIYFLELVRNNHYHLADSCACTLLVSVWLQRNALLIVSTSISSHSQTRPNLSRRYLTAACLYSLQIDIAGDKTRYSLLTSSTTALANRRRTGELAAHKPNPH